VVRGLDLEEDEHGIPHGLEARVGGRIMTGRPDLLLSRLDEIGASLARSGKALALIGLGSAGLECERLDRYSDLDFFAIVADGRKRELLDDLSWLGDIHPIAYAFRNTPDGYKVLFEDGVFCEFAVFEQPELRHIPFAPGRMVWKKDGVPDDLRFPQWVQAVPEERSVEWSLGEALANLYTGLGRYRRGEKLAAMRLIQVFAVDRLLELAEKAEPPASSLRDPFALERRYEQRNPRMAPALPSFAQGYDRSVESARAILAFLDERFEVNPAIRRAILELCESGSSGDGARQFD
jgi:lincosamide nucleotidyltransferase